MMDGMDRAALRRSLVALGVTYSVLWACAPAFSGPPPVPMVGGRELEVGLAGGVTVATSEPPYGFESVLQPDGHLFFRAHTAPRLDVGIGVFGGTTSLLGAGAWIDWRIVDTDRLVLGPGVSAGFIYADASLPIAVRVAPGGWLYTRPRLGVGRAALPLGFALSLPQGVGLVVEGGATWLTTAVDGVSYGPYPVISLGVSWQLRP
jgi:hypothetical protein